MAVWGAYTTIPLILAYFVLQRKDIPLPRIFWLFAAFIFACGFTHLLDAFIFWWPAYRFSGMAKLTTAIVSWMTVGALIQVTPLALRLPGLAVVNQQLEQANNDLNAFAHIVSHDLRAPLRSMRQLGQWIREDVEKGGSPELEEHLRQLDEKAERMDSLIAGIMRYSSVTRDLEEEELKLHDANELVEEVLSLIHIPREFMFRYPKSCREFVVTPFRCSRYSRISFTMPSNTWAKRKARFESGTGTAVRFGFLR